MRSNYYAQCKADGLVNYYLAINLDIVHKRTQSGPYVSLNVNYLPEAGHNSMQPTARASVLKFGAVKQRLLA
jgi:hypothetical protein